MSKAMTAAQTRSALRKWGVDFIEYPGWELRSRPGGLGDVHGIVVHHTGSMSQTDDYLHFLFITGRPDEGIPGPLCNVSTDMDGDLHLGAIGRANHAGRGSSRTRDHVINEDYTGNLTPGADDWDAGNSTYYGNEIRFNGAQAMTAKAYRTVVLWCAAICDFHGWSAKSVIGHKEHTGRKNDPGHTDMATLRKDIQAALDAGPGDTSAGSTPVLPGADLTIHAWSVWYAGTQAKGITGETWKDAYQVMEFAANPKIGVITIAQRDAWVTNTTTEADWADGNRIFTATVKKLQAKWGLATTGLMDARTTAWFRGYGYTII
jgi:hypothetical protein